METQRTYPAVILREDDWFVAHCLSLGVVSQGRTIEEAKTNLQEAVELYIESFPDEELPAPSNEMLIYSLDVRHA